MGVNVHYGRVTVGKIAVGDQVTAQVDAERRIDIQRNHTATHLLHKALQETLGTHAQQRGSLVEADRLRFDFAHLTSLSDDEMQSIEQGVNEKIREDLPVAPTNTTLDEARRQGAMMLFGEKYGDDVRMASIDGYSRELCGGTHLDRTGQIGEFVITTESSVGSGLRRIEALTGRGAERYVHDQVSLLREIADMLGAQKVTDLRSKLQDVLEESRENRREVERLRNLVARNETVDVVSQSVSLNGVKVLAAQVDAPDMDGLRQRVDHLRDKLGTSVIVLGSVINDRPQLVAAVTSDLVDKGLDAGAIIRQVSAVVGGGGGGRPTLAQAGGKDAGKLDAALGQVQDLVSDALGD